VLAFALFGTKEIIVYIVVIIVIIAAVWYVMQGRGKAS
jgi:uncharacterized membrane protein YuzA (DUF378 family)